MLYRIKDKILFKVPAISGTICKGTVVNIENDTYHVFCSLDEMTYLLEEDNVIGGIAASDYYSDDDPTADKKGDVVKEPSHYTQGGIQPLDYITANDMSFLEGNVIKYVTRYKYKNGLEDLKKAKQYLNKLIKENSVNN